MLTHAKHIHTPHKSHVHHAHHAFKYGRFYKCTYCGRKGHLAKFCYDRINGTNNHVWVRSINPHGPKKIWVPKSTPIVFDVSVGSHLK